MAKAKAPTTRKKKLTKTFNDVFEASVDANIENFIAEIGNGSIVEGNTVVEEGFRVSKTVEYTE
tara:strand:+ start:130 stop:321 length:192 start_codon:yes stop_codon:yes gene_type:complete